MIPIGTSFTDVYLVALMVVGVMILLPVSCVAIMTGVFCSRGSCRIRNRLRSKRLANQCLR